MDKGFGASSGSREPDPQAVPAPTGFDPAREDDMEALEGWAFNVMLESSAGQSGGLLAIGGAVLEIDSLHRILTWARGQAIAAGSRRAETRSGLGAKQARA